MKKKRVDLAGDLPPYIPIPVDCAVAGASDLTTLIVKKEGKILLGGEELTNTAVIGVVGTEESGEGEGFEGEFWWCLRMLERINVVEKTGLREFW